MAFAYARQSSTLPRWLLAVLVATASVACGLEARADDAKSRTSSLSWVRLQGAESCIATQELAQAVEQRLARKVFVSASEADVSVEGHVARAGTPARWLATLTIRDASGEVLGTRELESVESDCSALDESLVFVLSVMIDPDAESRAREEPPKPVEPAPAPSPPPKVIVRRERVVVAVPAPPPDPWRVEAGIGVAVALGLLPTTSLGITTSVVLEPPGFWGILLVGTYWFDSSVDAERGAESEVRLAHAGVGLCPLGWQSARVSHRLCAGVMVGSLRSHGEGFDTELSDQEVATHVFVPNRFGLRIAGPLAATAGVALLVPLVRTELTYRRADGESVSLYDPAPIAVAADLGLALFFP